MRSYYLASFIILSSLFQTLAHKEFTRDACLAIHNELRALHQDTGDVIYDMKLEKSANESSDFLFYSDRSEVDL